MPKSEPIPSAYLVQMAEAVRELFQDFGGDPLTLLRQGADFLNMVPISGAQCDLCAAVSEARLSITYPPDGEPAALCAIHAGLRAFEVGYGLALLHLTKEPRREP